ncbi:MAG: response regulator transcription factor [Candidatus Carbobacillus altaicus]|uniref:Two-component response regulator SA14-24 n=1 Tax=Candidatus Carbonibacillus altaicus TaxID=2163959 RepID=A0A2R6XXE4_9BACL|nr:response regulator transcription factor [Candidatus Carbobacillus altaicus]PTQ55093.1 MAG: Two-component response regulator SA14-24 [Candidatus Carbobacillus altaicus]
MGERILIIEDEAPIREIIAYQLEKNGFQVCEAADGREGLNKALAMNPDLIVLDLMLPGLDGFELLKTLRQTHDTPVVVLTARDEEMDKVLGLEMGADDYVTKPFSNRELLARIRANLRRLRRQKEDGQNDTVVLGELVIDLKLIQVKKRGEILPLTPREFDLLRYLLEHRGQVISRERLLNQVWSYDFLGDVRTVDVTVRRLREKIEDHPGEPRYLLTKRGAGYYIPHIPELR